MWSNEEEDECRQLIVRIDEKLKEKNTEVHQLHLSLYHNYLILRNWSIFTLIQASILFFFNFGLGTILSIQSIDLAILILLFARFEVSGKNVKWQRAFKMRNAIHSARETIQADLEAGKERKTSSWQEYRTNLPIHIQ
uniref:Uncharacterized protein n=1 Tax=viral metagenome TaxID=1070528 RepID=A0A6C0CIF0_9ZZZZ